MGDTRARCRARCRAAQPTAALHAFHGCKAAAATTPTCIATCSAAAAAPAAASASGSAGHVGAASSGSVLIRHTVSRPCSSGSRRQRRGSVSAAAAPAGGGGTSARLQQVLDKIDELNSKDPRTVQDGGKAVPYELAYSRWMSGWVAKLTADGDPPLTEELQIAARGQHVQRWTSPRSSYPEGRAAYLKWREDLKGMHSRVVGGLMEQAGYPPESVQKVTAMMLKKSLKTSAEAQVLEDALCLVFLEHQFTELRLKEGDDKMVDIVKKTWKKIGPKGRAAALSLKLAPEELSVVQRALA